MANTAQINIKVDSKQADNSVNRLNNELEGTVKQTMSLKAQLRAMQNELNTLDEGSARFRELSIEAGKLRDQIKDTQDVINSTAGTSVENLGTALNGVASIGIAGFQAVTAAQALFGVESEQIQKQLLKIQAIAGLADAVKVLGGLGDTLTQIKASATAAAQSLGILTTATVTETAATEGATVAQEGLNTAMKLNPVGAIIAGLIALTTAVIAFTGRSQELTKEEKKRKVELDAINKAQKESIKTIGEESGKFVGLIYQLKETNAGSKERKDLIKEINKEYGTTLKNITDETEFQRLLNKEVEDYIQYQTVKLRIQKNEEAFNKVLTKKLELETKIQQAQAEAERVAKALNITVGDYYRNNSEVVKSLEDWNAQLSGAEFKLQSYTKRINVLKGAEDELTNSGKKYVEQNKDIKKSNDDTAKSYEEITNAIKALNEQSITNTQEIQKIQAEQTKSRLDDLQLELDFSLDKIEIESKAIKDKINTEIKDQSKKSEFIRNLDAATQNAIRTQRELTAAKIKLLSEEEIKLQTKLLEDLNALRQKTTEEQYQSTILFREIQIQSIENQLQNQRLSYKEFIDLEQRRVKQVQSLAQLEYSLKKYQSEQLLKNDKAALIKKYKDEYDLIITYNEESKKYEVKTSKEKWDELTKIGGDALAKQANLEIVSKVEVNAQLGALENKHQMNLQQIVKDAAQKKKDIEIKTDEEIFKRKVELTQQIANISNQLLSGFESLSNSITEKRLAQIQTIYNAEIEANEAALANKSITDEEYAKNKAELENQQLQKERALKRQSFLTNKRFSLAQATIDGANSVLSAFAGTPGGVIIKTIAAAAAGIFAALQIAVIENTQFTAAKGGIVPQNGKPSTIDSVPSMLAPGETVINSNSSGMFPELLNLINMAGGGNNLLPQVSLGNTTKPQPVFQENRRSELVRAYVVEQDITSSQQRVKRIQNTSTF